MIFGKIIDDFKFLYHLHGSIRAGKRGDKIKEKKHDDILIELIKKEESKRKEKTV